MGQGKEACTDRPSEVSVIRFVSRNRTIEEITPKKDIYTCKQRGCGKIFTNHDEYKTHEILEALKIRFICREPGCGEELSDPGSMWRHYQEWHSNETNVFSCPYTNCDSVHVTSFNLEEHIEACHRQLPILPTEPEIICFEDTDNVIDTDGSRNIGIDYEQLQSDNYHSNQTRYTNDQIMDSLGNENLQNKKHPSTNKFLSKINKLSKNDNLVTTKENFSTEYDTSSPKCSEFLNVDNLPDNDHIVYVNEDVTITKNMKNESYTIDRRTQEQRIDLGNLERVFRSGIDCKSSKLEDVSTETNSNCSDDEEYTPKKQRMSRQKQETYVCDINGCGKKYKYISHYRHHQDSHKLILDTINLHSSKQTLKLKQGKASTVSFFICKIPGCGAQVDNVTGLWKHYQDNHAHSKPMVISTGKTNESFRCKFSGCEVEFNTTIMLYKHLNEVHSNSAINDSTNMKTVDGNSFHLTKIYQSDAVAPQINVKTDNKAKNVNLNEYGNDDDRFICSIVKQEPRD